MVGLETSSALIAAIIIICIGIILIDFGWEIYSEENLASRINDSIVTNYNLDSKSHYSDKS